MSRPRSRPVECSTGVYNLSRTLASVHVCFERFCLCVQLLAPHLLLQTRQPSLGLRRSRLLPQTQATPRPPSRLRLVFSRSLFRPPPLSRQSPVPIPLST